MESSEGQEASDSQLSSPGRGSCSGGFSITHAVAGRAGAEGGWEGGRLGGKRLGEREVGREEAGLSLMPCLPLVALLVPTRHSGLEDRHWGPIHV